MTALTVATVITPSRVSGARVLAHSLAEHHPGVPIVAALAGLPAAGVPAAGEPFAVIGADALGVASRSDPLAMCCALKPALIEHLLGAGHASVLYLDADQLLLAPVADLLERVRRHGLVLAPHLTGPLEGRDAIARELALLRSGAYNGGLLGCSDRPGVRRFLRFLRERIERHPVPAPERGLYYDQRWLDLAPGLVDDVHVLRSDDLNVGHWALPERLSTPPRLMHFSGFDPNRPDRVSRHTSLATSELGPAGALFGDYARRLLAAGWAETCELPFQAVSERAAAR